MVQMNIAKRLKKNLSELSELIYHSLNSDNHIFAGTGAGMARSTDGGANWTEINTGISASFVNALGIDETDEIFVGIQISFVIV